MEVKFKKLSESAIPFKYTREHDACMDIYSNEDVVLHPHETAIVHTGIAVKVPISYAGIVKGRSGLASKGILVHMGTIDEEYTGEIGVIMTNLNEYTYYHVSKGDRIAQFTIEPVHFITLKEVDNLGVTNRGGNGFGSSGI